MATLAVIWQYAAPAVGAALAWLIKRYLDAKGWEFVRALAYAILANPAMTDDAKQALANALVQANLERVEREAQKVKEKFISNGANKVPPLELDITEDK